MLRMCVRNYDTKQYNSPRNHITHIPVWGKFINSVPGPIVYYNSTGAETLLFNPIVEVGTPNIWDCSTNTDVIDVNTSSYLYETALRWNEWMNFFNACYRYIRGDRRFVGWIAIVTIYSLCCV